ncbi:hypothetical protein JVU11DRAFT_8014 [Chiua virens]|nr:hypothetical protein JVU11DRAFT_8014 [Chiua virens]
MTAAPARGVGRQIDIQSTAPRTPLPTLDDSATSAHPTSNSTLPPSTPASSTLQRGRPTNRYPDSLSRVPLHRRGTSKTYERLEDLLREAGYKETRVFTPDADRNTRSAAEKQDGGAANTVRASVGAVVDYITGLVSRGSSLSCETAPLEGNSTQSALHAWTPPSPLAHTAHIKDCKAKRAPSMSSLSRKGSSDSVRRRTCVDLSADASQRTPAHAYQVVQLHQSSRGLPHQSHSQPSTKPNPPNARAYLRHMASAPNIQPLLKRPSLSEASLRSHALGRERHTSILNDEDDIADSDYEFRSRAIIEDDNVHQVHPPLPRNWLETVTKALLSGVGGPAALTSDAASTRTSKTVSTHESSATSDKSNREARGRGNTRGVKPPLLCVQVQDMKATTSAGQVACTRVMCRSTPTSRASSRVRNGVRDDRTNVRSNGKKREDRLRNRRRGKDRDADVVPTLARTKVENDDWMAPPQRYSSGWGMEGSAQAYPDGTWTDDSDDDDDEEDEGELDLDRLLVPARRQHSIHSLRKHLQRPLSQLSSGRRAPLPGSLRSGRGSPFGEAPTGRLDWGDTSWGRNRGRKWSTNQGEEDEDEDSRVFSGSDVGMGRSSSKWKGTLPSLTQWTTSS